MILPFGLVRNVTGVAETIFSADDCSLESFGNYANHSAGGRHRPTSNFLEASARF
jgi:hypothetical protein